MGLSESATSLSRPTITLPPRPTFENWFAGGASPGPMTLVSNFFSDGYPDSGSRTFTQLLAGAMASPVAVAAGLSPSFFMGHSTEGVSVTEGRSDEEGGDEKSGFKQNRPASLVVARSPVFMVPPGMSPSGLLNSPGFFSPGQSPFGMSHQQALAQVTAQAVLSQANMHIQTDYQPSLLPASSGSLTHIPSFIPNANVHPIVSEPNNSSIKESSDISHSDKKSLPPSDRPGDDGYNWRKYGQKQVKGSEYPRSYYKCTHLHCPVKKKVERSLDGQIIEIIYKGQHNHGLPQSSKPTRDGSHGNMISQPRAEGTLKGQTAVKRSTEFTSSDSVLQSGQEYTEETLIQLPKQSDSEDVGGGETRVGMGVNDEPNPKRRSTESGTSEPASSHKTVTESKIIVQTRSEVDLLDDGYRWRKYGQKIVKGNHHPRSYYKCTNSGCNVRKHVERATADPKAVITTYEGKHNHDLPALRNSSHNTANGAPRLKPHNLVDEKHALLKERDVGSKEQRSISLLQLKEEKVAV
uniref:WRKY transcription factor 39 n=1 Tax=Santalum album TaxID=35974 RepID=A0A650C2X0_SANAL|nr:WRKY transcription factor 39 [Santalum album]